MLLSLLDQALVQDDEGRGVTQDTIRTMMGLADKGRVLTLFDNILQGQTVQALEGLEGLYEDGALPPVLVRDMMDLCYQASRAKLLGPLFDSDESQTLQTALHTISQRHSMGQLNRAWQILLKAHEETQKSPDHRQAAEMGFLRLSCAMTLPPPEQAAQILGGAPVSGSSGPPPSAPGHTEHRTEQTSPAHPEETPAQKQDVLPRSAKQDKHPSSQPLKDDIHPQSVLASSGTYTEKTSQATTLHGMTHASGTGPDHAEHRKKKTPDP